MSRSKLKHKKCSETVLDDMERHILRLGVILSAIDTTIEDDDIMICSELVRDARNTVNTMETLLTSGLTKNG